MLGILFFILFMLWFVRHQRKATLDARIHRGRMKYHLWRVWSKSEMPTRTNIKAAMDYLSSLSLPFYDFSNTRKYPVRFPMKRSWNEPESKTLKAFRAIESNISVWKNPWGWKGQDTFGGIAKTEYERRLLYSAYVVVHILRWFRYWAYRITCSIAYWIHRYFWYSEVYELYDLAREKRYWLRNIYEARCMIDNVKPLPRIIADNQHWYSSDFDDERWVCIYGATDNSHLLDQSNVLMVYEDIHSTFGEETRGELWEVEGDISKFGMDVIVRIFHDWDKRRLYPIQKTIQYIEELDSGLDGYPVVDDEHFSELEQITSYHDLKWDAEDFIDIDKMPEGTNWDSRSLVYNEEVVIDKDKYPNDTEEIPQWVFELHHAMYEMGYDADWGDNGRSYRTSDVVEAVHRLGWMVDEDDLTTYASRRINDYPIDYSLPSYRRCDDPSDFDNPNSKRRWATYHPVTELRTVGDGKFYTSEYFHTHIQPQLL